LVYPVGSTSATSIFITCLTGQSPNKLEISIMAPLTASAIARFVDFPVVKEAPLYEVTSVGLSAFATILTSPGRAV